MKEVNNRHIKIIINSILVFLTLICVTITAFSFVKILDNKSKTSKMEINSLSIGSILDIPKYTPLEDDIVIPDIKVAPINDKQDGQKRSHGNSKNTNVNDAKKMFEAKGISVGIDVSKYQGNIDWKAVKNDGVEFAMIRVGYRGYETGEIALDPYFYQNVKGATNNGVKVGIYFYSVAKTELEAMEEAKWTVNIIRNYKITYPVAFDLEDFDRYRLTGVSNAQLNKNAVAFLEYIKKSGYQPMHYGSKSKFGAVWNMNTLNKYKIWLAHYTTSTDYAGIYNMWQYSSKGSVKGINGYVDMNIAYFRYSQEAKEAASEEELRKDPNKEVIDSTPFTETNEQAKTTTGVNFRRSPSTYLDNIIQMLNNGEMVLITGTSNNGWARVQYKDIIGYVSLIYLEIIPSEEPEEPDELT